MSTVLIKHSRSASLAGRLAYDYRHRQGGVETFGRLRYGVIRGDARTDAHRLLTGNEAGRCECFSIVISFAASASRERLDAKARTNFTDAVSRCVDAIKPGGDYIATWHRNTGHDHLHVRLANDDGHGRAIQISRRQLFDWKKRLSWAERQFVSSWKKLPDLTLVRHLWATMGVPRLVAFLRAGAIQPKRFNAQGDLSSITVVGCTDSPSFRVRLDRPCPTSSLGGCRRQPSRHPILPGCQSSLSNSIP